MERDDLRRLNAFLGAHHGVISRRQALALGVGRGQIDQLVRRGTLQPLQRAVYGPAGARPTPAGKILAACLAAGSPAAASHGSAAWLWGLQPRPPDRPVISVPHLSGRSLRGVETHRSTDLDVRRVVEHRAIPVTDPIRTLADLGSRSAAGSLADAVDRALARRLVTVEALVAEIDRLGRQGRSGPSALRTVLGRRGLTGAADPSVLESRTARLLASWGVVPCGAEVVVCGSRYRVDFLLRPWLVLEVDGYAYHSSPEDKAADSVRRNDLRLAGFVVLEADWVTVMHAPNRLRVQVEAALALGPPAHQPG